MWDSAILKHMQEVSLPEPGSIIAIYSPLTIEVNCLALAEMLMQGGYKLCLPTVIELNTALKFRSFDLDDPLQKGLTNTLEPLPDQPFVTPKCVIAPMLGFGPNCVRLGFGAGGYFDRTLALMPGTPTIGLAYDLQYCPDLKKEPHDIALDCIVTEKAIHHRS